MPDPLTFLSEPDDPLAFLGAPKTSVAARNNNPGNLKDPATGKFRQFTTPEEGYNALVADIEAKQTGKSSTGLKPESTLQQFFNVYAPSTDANDPTHYAATVAARSGVDADTPIRKIDSKKLA